jgi:RHS repeat-associated protein
VQANQTSAFKPGWLFLSFPNRALDPGNIGVFLVEQFVAAFNGEFGQAGATRLEADGRDQYAQVVVLNTSGALIGSQLSGPYGNSRYSSDTLPTSIGFTGQQTDSVTGLDYFNARYYDPVTGQFLSADVVQGNAQGTSPYRYVMGGRPGESDGPDGAILHRW